MRDKKLKALIKEYFLPELPEFKWKGRLLYHENIQELLRGVYLDSSGFSVGQFTIEPFIQPLYVPNDSIVLTCGERIRDEILGTWFSVSDPRILVSLPFLVRRAKGMLDQIKTPHDFYCNRELSGLDNIRTLETYAYTSCYLKYPQAISDLDRLISQGKADDRSIAWVAKLVADAENLRETYANNPEAAAELFRAWRDQTVQILKLS